jgi:hypothetical protein
VTGAGPVNSTPGEEQVSKRNNAWHAEDQYWQANFPGRPYALNKNYSYPKFRPAYQFGVSAFQQFGGESFDSVSQAQLRAEWEQAKGNSDLTWEQAEPAVRDAYIRLYDRKNSTEVRPISNP